MRVSNLKHRDKKEYGVITPEILDEMFETRELTAALLTRSTDPEEAFMAFLVLTALEQVHAELKRLME